MKSNFLMMALAVVLMSVPAFAGNCGPCDQSNPCDGCNACYSRPCDLFAGLKSLLACKPCGAVSTCDPCEPVVACCDRGANCDPCANAGAANCDPCANGANCDPCAEACGCGDGCGNGCGRIFDKPRCGVKKFFDGIFKPRNCGCSPCGCADNGCNDGACGANDGCNCGCGDNGGCGANDGCNGGCGCDANACDPACGPCDKAACGGCAKFGKGTFAKKFARWWNGSCGSCNPCDAAVNCDPCAKSYDPCEAAGCGCGHAHAAPVASPVEAAPVATPAN